MTDSHNPTMKQKADDIVYSLDCCSSDCDGWVHQENRDAGKKAIKALIADEVVKELEAIVQLRENRNGLLAYDEASEQIKKRIAERKKELL